MEIKFYYSNSKERNIGLGALSNIARLLIAEKLFVSWSWDLFRDLCSLVCMKKSNVGTELYIGIDREVIIGVLLVRDLHINTFVKEEYRCKGYGKQLVEFFNKNTFFRHSDKKLGCYPGLNGSYRLYSGYVDRSLLKPSVIKSLEKGKDGGFSEWGTDVDVDVFEKPVTDYLFLLK